MVDLATKPTAQPSPPRAEAKKRRRWWLGLTPAALLLLVAVVGPMVMPHSATDVVGDSSLSPSGQFWFGTDADGLDVFSRTFAATRLNVEIATAVVLLSTIGGVLLGLAVGMNESRRGPMGMLARAVARTIDLVQAVPAVLVGLVLVAFYGGSTTTLISALSVILLPIQMRLVRVEVLKVRGDAYVDAARMAGLSEVELTMKVVLPNSSRAALENTSVVFALAVILTAALGFLGVGEPPPTPEWGAMIAKGATDAAVGRWWAATFPTIALALSVAAVSSSLGSVLRRFRHR